jgi:hypothetical protein
MTDQEVEFLQQENDRLRNELKQVKEKESAIHEDYKKQLLGARTNQALTLLLAGFKTQFDDLPVSVKDQALKEIISTRLAADSAELTTDESGQLLLRRKDGTNFFGEDHRLLNPDSYLEKMMARDKILKVNDTKPDNTPREANLQVTRNESGNNMRNNRTYGNSGTATVTTLIDEALKSFA